MRIIKVSGTSGSGKSTLVRNIMALCVAHRPLRIEECPIALEGLEDRTRPIGYTMELPRSNQPLFVPGHYETACGGCDTIAKHQFDNIDKLVRGYHSRGFHVLFEGLLLSAESARLIQLQKDVPPYTIYAIELNTPLEDCLAGIKARRDAKGGSRAGEPFADSVLKNATAKQKGTRSTIAKCAAAGIHTVSADRKEALRYVRELLGL